MIQLRGVLAAAVEVQRFCQAQGWPFCLIGGVAVQRWGEPRLTQDVDATVLAGFGSEAPVADALLGAFTARRDDARQFALQHRVLLLRTGSGVDVDVALGALPFEERTIQRASAWSWGGDTDLVTCSAEDLVAKLNLAQIREELVPLLELKEEPEALARLERQIATVDRRLRPT